MTDEIKDPVSEQRVVHEIYSTLAVHGDTIPATFEGAMDLARKNMTRLFDERRDHEIALKRLREENQRLRSAREEADQRATRAQADMASRLSESDDIYDTFYVVRAADKIEPLSVENARRMDKKMEVDEVLSLDEGRSLLLAYLQAGREVRRVNGIAEAVVDVGQKLLASAETMASRDNDGSSDTALMLVKQTPEMLTEFASSLLEAVSAPIPDASPRDPDEVQGLIDKPGAATTGGGGWD